MKNSVPKDFNPPKSHPLYFIRKGLFNKINEYSPNLYGDILDFGCGAKPYESLFKNARSYVGVDYNSAGHSHQDENIDFYYDGKTLPFTDNKFDGVFSSEVFEHIFNLEEIIPEIHRVLKPNGVLLFTCPFVWEEHEIPVDFARYTRFALKHILEKNGFKILTIDKNGDFLTALHQQFIVYLNDFWINEVKFFSKIKLFKKIVRQIIVPMLNYFFLIARTFFPVNKKLYLNTIVLAKKI